MGLQGPGCALKALNCLKDFNFLLTSLTDSDGHGPPRAGLPNFNPARTGLKMANEYATCVKLLPYKLQGYDRQDYPNNSNR